jgi:cell shape-determining protein MreC
MLFIWCLLGGLICLFAPPSLTSRLQLAYTHVFSWPLQAGRNLSLATAAVPALTAVDSPVGEPSQAERERLLKNRLANLEAQLKEAHKVNDQLAGLRMQFPWDRMAFVPADITVANLGQGVLFINRGQQDGVAAGQYVLGDLSVIGIISSASSQTAQVRLITNLDSKISVTIGESDVTRVMDVRSGGTIKIPLVPMTHAVREGDAVRAIKTPGLLDAPVIVGRISQCRPDPAHPELWDITVEPACKIAALTRVAVIAAAPKQ